MPLYANVGAVSTRETIRLAQKAEADGLVLDWSCLPDRTKPQAFRAQHDSRKGLFVDHRLEEKFSGFWYPKQKELRDNLKQAREDVRTLQANLTVPADREYHASV